MSDTLPTLMRPGFAALLYNLSNMEYAAGSTEAFARERFEQIPEVAPPWEEKVLEHVLLGMRIAADRELYRELCL